MLMKIKKEMKSNKAAIIGNINYLHINWSCIMSEQRFENQFLNTFNYCFLEKLVLEHTREEAVLSLALVTHTRIGSRNNQLSHNSAYSITEFNIFQEE